MRIWKNIISIHPDPAILLIRLTIGMVFISSQILPAQDELRNLLNHAAQNYPAILAKQAQTEASKINILLEENTFRPSLNIFYQANYATVNNITGMSYPGYLAPISGPPSPGNNLSGVFGSAAGMLFRWNPATFGQREQKIAYYQKRLEQQMAAIEDEVLKLKANVSNLYLEIAAIQELIRVYEKNIQRNEFNLEQVGTLVSNGIRPSVDSLKFLAELSKAHTALYQLQHLLQSCRYEIAELLSLDDPQEIRVDTQFFQQLPTLLSRVIDSISNPALQSAMLDVRANELWLEQIRTARKPELEFWSTLYARGSGVDFNGERNSWEGWAFSRFNYGFGAQISYPLLAGKDVKLKTEQQTAQLLASRQQLDAVKLNLNRQENIAMSYLTSSLNIAAQIPAEHRAAEAVYRVLQSRYRTGLDDYTGFMEAQYHLLDAEVRLKSAYLTAWQALLQLAVTKGDIDIFLNQIEN